MCSTVRDFQIKKYPITYCGVGVSPALDLYHFTLINVSSISLGLTSPPTPLGSGEGSKKLIFTLLLPRLVGEGGWEGEVHRTDVNHDTYKYCRDRKITVSTPSVFVSKFL
jgi:hypothetical protein